MGKTVDAGILDVIELAYQAASEPELWAQVLEGVADLLDGDKSIMLRARAESPADLPSARFDPEVVRLYFQSFEAINPIQAGIDRADGVGYLVDQVSTDQSWVAKNELTGSDFHDQFMRPAGFRGVLMIPLPSIGMINVMRPQHAEEFERAELAAGQALQGPLRRAGQLGRRLGAKRRVGEALAQLAERASGPVILVDVQGRIVHANPAAEALIRSGDGVHSTALGLRAATPDASRRLSRLIGQAASAAQAGMDASGVMALPRPSGRRALAALVGPVHAEPGAGAERLALISIIDPEQPVVASQDRLRELFGLTPAEVKVVAELAAGYETRAVAQRLGLSLHTVRVLLARAMAKTDVHRQSELMSLVIRTAGGPG